MYSEQTNIRNNVLYFPYIAVPNTVWFTRILLYWDRIGSIVPYDYIENPELHDEYTRSLVEANLVVQVMPGMYLYNAPNVTPSFLEYLETAEPVLDARRESFLQGRAVPIHMEKLQDLGNELIWLGLASFQHYPWYSVEKETADDYMGYLATILGRFPDLGFAPITDQIRCLTGLISSNHPSHLLDREINSMRLQILEEALPAPAMPLRAYEIERFKDRHGEQLSRFRRKIELELTNLADINNLNLQRRRLQLVKEEIRDETADIRSKMEAQGWRNIVFGKLCALLAAIPGISPIPKLINAVYKAIAGDNSVDNKAPLAYAAYAQKELLKAPRRKALQHPPDVDSE
jgi:hypothetical protein